VFLCGSRAGSPNSDFYEVKIPDLLTYFFHICYVAEGVLIMMVEERRLWYQIRQLSYSVCVYACWDLMTIKIPKWLVS
jgi:hypothetical protein